MKRFGSILIDGRDAWTDFGLLAIKKGWEDWLSFPDMKPPFIHNWEDEDGIEVDLNSVFIQEKNVSLQIVFIASSEYIFWKNYRSLFDVLTSPELRQIYIEEIGRSFDLYYTKSSLISKFTRLKKTKKIAVSMTIDFVMPNFGMYSISYDSNGGSIPPANGRVWRGEDYIVSNEIPTRSGYVFDGWNKSGIGQKGIVNPGDYIINIFSNIRLTARWIKIGAPVYTITYDATGGTDSPINGTVLEGSDYRISSQFPRKTGYVFAGWAVSGGGQSGTKQPNDMLYNITGPVTLTALWDETIIYNVIYDANGGTGAPANGTVARFEDYKISSVVPTRSGYTFTGWRVQMGLSYSNYNPGDIISWVTAHITLTAQWTQLPTHTVTYNANGGTGAPSTGIVIDGDNYTISNQFPQREGWQFAGWIASGGGQSGTKQPNGALTNVTGNVILTAIWTEITYNVVFVTNGGTGGPSGGTVNFGQNFVIPLNIPDRTGYIFDGWYVIGDDREGSFLNSGDTIYNIKGNIIVTAQWKPYRPAINYLPGATSGVVNMPNDSDVSYGGNYKISLQAPERSGYVFTGWTASGSGQSGTKQPGDQMTNITSAVTLTAQWNLAIVYHSITYIVPGGGADIPQNGTVASGGSYKISGSQPNRPGVIFVGWTASGGGQSGTKQPQDTMYNITGDVTLTAIWLNEYSVTFALNGGSGNGGYVFNPMSVFHGDNFFIPYNEPVLSGYTFTGWTASGGGQSGTKQPGTYMNNVTGNVTLTAQWQAVPYYTYAIDLDGGLTPGSGGTEPGQYLAGSTIQLRTVSPTKENFVNIGYVFVEWSINGVSGYNAGQIVTTNMMYNITAKAIWQEIRPMISFGGPGSAAFGPRFQVPYGSLGIGPGVGIPINNIDPYMKFTGWDAYKYNMLGLGELIQAGIQPGGSLSQGVIKDTIFITQWRLGTYKVILNPGAAGVSDMPLGIGTDGERVQLPNSWPSRTGYIFSGWYVENGPQAGQVLMPQQYVGSGSGNNAIQEDITITAKWTAQ